MLAVFGNTFAQQASTASAQIEQLVGDLAAKDVRVRWYAAYSLGQMGPDAELAIEPLARILANRTDHEYIRDAAAWTLGRIGAKTPEALTALEQSLESTLPSVRRASAGALGAIGPAAKPTLPALARALKDTDPVVRVRAAESLWRIAKRPEAVVALLAALRASERDAYEAALALGRLGYDPDDNGSDRVVDALKIALTHSSGDVRRAAKRSLGQIKDRP